MTIDLHCHSRASDGALSPQELVAHAAACGVEMLSITDHDTVDAYALINRHEPLPLRLVPGIEFSAHWRNRGVHVVGLNVDPGCASLNEAVTRQRLARDKRAERIAERLEKAGAANVLEGATRLADGAPVGRAHFARHLVDTGFVSCAREAFRKYLGDGKPGDVKHVWPGLETVVEWIRDSGGIAVLAHPARYKLTGARLAMLVDEFRRAGGRGIEVISGNQTLDVTRRLGTLCADSGLLASCGSDFHRPECPWARLGRFPALPSACRPVWSEWMS